MRIRPTARITTSIGAGGRNSVASPTGSNWTRRPNAPIVGTHHGYFADPEVRELLRSTKPDIVFAGMGFPRQERWLEENLGPLKIPVGVGGPGSKWNGAPIGVADGAPIPAASRG